MRAGFRIDDELAAFLVQGNGMIVATRDRALAPHVVRACGVQVIEPDRIAVLVPKATGARARANLDDNDDIAVTVSSPRNYRTVQLKGKRVRVADASPQDVVGSEEQLRGFADALKVHGWTRQAARNVWLFDLWRIEMHVTAAYHQTPGPGTGGPLGVSRGH